MTIYFYTAFYIFIVYYFNLVVNSSTDMSLSQFCICKYICACVSCVLMIMMMILMMMIITIVVKHNESNFIQLIFKPKMTNQFNYSQMIIPNT